MSVKVRLTVTESACRSGFHAQGQEFILDGGSPACPPVCMELWHYAYPYVWALLNGADLDDGPGRSKSADISCPDGGRVRLHIEVI